MKFAATVQFKESRAQWTVSQARRSDGMGFTNYGIDATDWNDATTQAVTLFHKGRADSADAEFGMLLDGTPDFILLSCEAPRESRVIQWVDAS